MPSLCQMFASSARTRARSWAAIVAVALTFAAAACCRASVDTRPTDDRSPWHRLRLGLCEDYPEETRSLAAAESDLAHAQALGATVLRIAFGWDAMEPEPGRYDWRYWDDFVRRATEQHHLQLIPYICYTPRWAARDPGADYWRSPPRDNADFARFLRALVKHYRPWIHSWELWNEPDNASYWLGDEKAFAALVRSGSEAVLEADPQAKIVLGGIATNLDFLAQLFRDDHLGSRVSVVNVHSYFETWHHDAIESLPRTLNEAANIISRYGDGQELWMAETGYSTVGPRPATSDYYRPRFDDEHTPEAQANALVRTVVLIAADEHVSLAAWYRLNDLPSGETVIGDDNNRHLGIYSADQRLKPAASAFEALARLFRRAYRVVPVRVTSGAAEGAEIHAFVFEGGEGRVFIWRAMEGSATASEVGKRDRRNTHLAIEVPSARRLAATADAAFGAANNSVSIDANDPRRATLTLHGSRVDVLDFEAESK